MRKALVLLCGLLVFGSAAAGTTVKPGETPPQNLGKTLAGRNISLASLHGDVVVISFWATWCHYCMQELPIWAGIQKIAARKGMHMQVVAVNYEQRRHVFYRAVHILAPRVPGLILTSDPHGKIGKPYGVGGLPFMVMLHRNGKVAYVHVGYDKSQLDTLIREVNGLLNERVPESR